LLTGKQ